jgi:HTH-type transcriptional regulator / antitoxin HigA
MEVLKYKIIKNKSQYREYCGALEQLLTTDTKSKDIKDEIELLTLLIEKWDEEHNTFQKVNPIELLQHLIAEKKLKSKDLADVLKVSKGLVSDILNYKKGLSKEIIRVLAEYFKVSQEAFNRPYKLNVPVNSRLKNASVMNTTKTLQVI